MSTPESTPRVGRWNGTGWLCECRESMYNSPEADVCHFCHAVRPALPETPAPRVEVRDDYGAKMWRQLEEMAQAVKQADADENAVVAWMWDTLGVKLKSTDAQVVGKEPIGVHRVEREYVAWDWETAREGAGKYFDDYPEKMQSALHRFAERWFAAGAALRAVPVEGGEPVCYAATRDGHPVLPNAIRAHKYEAQRHAELLGPEFYAVPLYAHPAPDGDALDAARYRFLRDNPFQLRAIDGNATWRGNVSAGDFDAHTDVAMANPAFTPTPSEDRPDAR